MQPTFRQQEEQDDNELELTPHEKQLKEKEEKELEIVTRFYESLKQINPIFHPSFEELKTWRSTYGRFYCSSIVEPEQIFVWRPIYRQEWREFVSLYGNAPDVDRQEGLLKKCLLYPPVEVVTDKCPAGYLPAMETKIMYQSGFVSDGQLLNSIKVIK